MPTAIKFCGLTRAIDVEHALALGVEHIGLVVAEHSPRRLTIDQARALAAQVRAAGGSTGSVLLVRDQTAAFVTEACAQVAPDRVQFHGSESEQEIARLRLAIGHWKALGLAGIDVPEALLASHVKAEALLLDGHAPGAAGGSGQRLDLSRWPRGGTRRLILAGGLDPDTVADAITAVRPHAVDVSSGIESAPGVKDPGRMRAFVAAVRGL